MTDTAAQPDRHPVNRVIAERLAKELGHRPEHASFGRAVSLIAKRLDAYAEEILRQRGVRSLDFAVEQVAAVITNRLVNVAELGIGARLDDVYGTLRDVLTDFADAVVKEARG